MQESRHDDGVRLRYRCKGDLVALSGVSRLPGMLDAGQEPRCYERDTDYLPADCRVIWVPRVATVACRCTSAYTLMQQDAKRLNLLALAVCSFKFQPLQDWGLGP
jgi:hypothetical protein